MAVKVKYAMALYPKNYITRSTTYMESFIIVSKIAQLSHYAALLHHFTQFQIKGAAKTNYSAFI